MSEALHLLAARQIVQGQDEDLECVVAGDQGPTIVLINGSGGPVDGWYRILLDLCAHACVFAYHRPGIGKSPRPRQAQTVGQMVSSLRAALGRLNLPGPYLLVGHSFGGLIAQYYARRFPKEVRGVLLLESTAPEDLALHRLENRLQRLVRRASEFLLPTSPFAETEQTAATLAQLAAAPDFPPIPLTVLTGQKPALSWATPAAQLRARAEGQRRLAALSPCGRHVFAPQSGHFPQLSEPALVAREILALLPVEAPETRAPSLPAR